MSVALLTILGVALAGLLAQVQWGFTQLGRRIDRLDERLGRVEERLTALEVKVAEIGQRLDDHITDHPGPTERLVQP